MSGNTCITGNSSHDDASSRAPFGYYAILMKKVL